MHGPVVINREESLAKRAGEELDACGIDNVAKPDNIGGSLQESMITLFFFFLQGGGIGG